METRNMNALVFEQTGDAQEVLSLKAVDIPRQTGNNAVIRVLSSTINPADFFFIKGNYRFKPEFPQIAGLEATGVIEKVSARSVLKKGMHVAFFSQRTWAEYVAVDESRLLVVPSEFPVEKAAQLALNGMTAWGLLEAAGLSSGDWFLVTAGNSTVSKLIMQIANDRDIKVIAAIRNPAEAKALHAYTQNIIDVSDTSLKETIGLISNGAKLNALIDSVGGPATTQIVKSLNQDGKVIIYGAMSGQPIAFDNSDFLYKNISVQGFASLAFYQSKSPSELQHIANELVRIFSDQTLVQNDISRFPMKDYQLAIAASKESKNGKVVLVPTNITSKT